MAFQLCTRLHDMVYKDNTHSLATPDNAHSVEKASTVLCPNIIIYDFLAGLVIHLGTLTKYVIT